MGPAVEMADPAGLCQAYALGETMLLNVLYKVAVSRG